MNMEYDGFNWNHFPFEVLHYSLEVRCCVTCERRGNKV